MHQLLIVQFRMFSNRCFLGFYVDNSGLLRISYEI
ncbi:MAG: hypothetical protein ACI97B_002674 [Verrucomicrobiales bacterium]